jgi:hypothetical protein
LISGEISSILANDIGWSSKYMSTTSFSLVILLRAYRKSVLY